MLNKYDLVVGLEIHVELKTKSKIFCGCKNEFSNKPNTQCCEVCLGMPGALPVLNENAVKKAIAISKILNCELNMESWFDRKHFVYMDLVKNFQITQYEKPIAIGGNYEIFLDDSVSKFKNIEIERIHLEEDAGKVIYKKNEILIDYNRSGVPLVEIVTKPVFNDVQEVRAFLEQLRIVLMSNDISDCKMNEGSYRFDVNISTKPKGSEKLGNRTEIKNMNSFKEAVKAIKCEFERQVEILEKGAEVLQQSLNWNEKTSQIEILREKETNNKYKFLREYNLPGLLLNDDMVEDVVIHLITDKLKQYVNNYGLTVLEAQEIIKNKSINNIYDEVINEVGNYKLVRNFFIEILLQIEALDFRVITSENIIILLNYLRENKINNTIIKKAIEQSLNTNISPVEIINNKNWFLINDEKEIEKIIDEVLQENEKLVLDYKDGKTKVIKSIVGKCMSKSNGLVNPIVLNNMIDILLNR